MKKKRIGLLRGICIICAALGWWGALYPQFTLVDGTYRFAQEQEDSSVQTERNVVESKPVGNELCLRIMLAKPEQIRLKSRLLTDLKELQSQRREVDESGVEQ